ncbi:hypothetical protein [Blastopirellula retiformator]|uniref:Twin-arginine translocation signal domain-containing protein n=1 Tax=Blastopirellula retiformator TaxID=2527970 RepID=A0A5C5V3D1_9BACT|nr:hypothetical protein [Blastopirellula retiformator]TWT33076.1 hypothetical protein Enr8_28960 [Blastopirellula retiformator]
MFGKQSRRGFLQTGAAVGLGNLAFLQGLRPVSAQEANVDLAHVQLQPEIAPLVKLIEETPRDRLLEEIGARINKGLSYQELLAALLLVGVKNVEPRPSVGHKFHAVLVVNSAHLASIASPPEHRWLPIFWALDYYKSAAARDVQERGDWMMPAVAEGKMPKPTVAGRTFAEAMENWDEAAADTAVASLARTAGMNEIYEQFYRFGARDFRSIGHKAIFVANSQRTLQFVGRDHAEPVLRSLAYALLMHEGSNPAERDDEADRPYRRNSEVAGKIRNDWQDGALKSDATLELITAMRSATNDDACDLTVELLNRGASPQSIWDALHLTAGEMLMQQPGIVALHAMTTTNALHYAFQTSGDDQTRRLMLLQNVAFLPMFRGAMKGRGKVKSVTIDDLTPEKLDRDSAATEQIFADLSRDPMTAARKTRGYLAEAGTGGATQLLDAARVLVFLKGNDAHDYKFSSAVLEDFYHVSPEWRDVYLGLSMFNLPGSGARDNSLVQRTRAALT